MARTPLSEKVTDVTTYAVPAGKYLVFAAHWVTGSGSTIVVKINAVEKATLFASASAESVYVAKPLIAKSGEVISLTAAGTSAIGIHGFLYDN